MPQPAGPKARPGLRPVLRNLNSGRTPGKRRRDESVLPLALRARLWYHYYKFHIIEQYIQFVYYITFDSAVH